MGMPQNSEDSYRSQASTILRLSFNHLQASSNHPPPSAFSVSTTWLINVNRCQLCQMFLPSLNLQATSNQPQAAGSPQPPKLPAPDVTQLHGIASLPHPIPRRPPKARRLRASAMKRGFQRDPSWWIQLRVEWMDGSKLVMIGIWF